MNNVRITHPLFEVGNPPVYNTNITPQEYMSMKNIPPHTPFYIAKLEYAGLYLFFSSPEPLGSQGELIGWP